MRLNKFIALSTGVSRRKADELITSGVILVNNKPAKIGQNISRKDIVTQNNTILMLPKIVTIAMNKPVGYICSKNGQGGNTIYDLLPPELKHLKAIGRLDKNSSGLLLMTNDGQLAQKLTHPTHKKKKIYKVTLNKELLQTDKQTLCRGIKLDDGLSKLTIKGNGKQLQVVIYEGRNRQIRRSFAALGYSVNKLHRIVIDKYKLESLKSGKIVKLSGSTVEHTRNTTITALQP